MAVKLMTWHRGNQKCGVCDYPATRELEDGATGFVSHACEEHIRTMVGGEAGMSHHTYMSHPNAYHAILEKK